MNKLGVKSPWIPAYLWMAAILIASSIPSGALSNLNIYSLDKIAHILLYSVLGFLLTRAFARTWSNISLPNIILLSIIIASSFAVLDECYQGFVPGRMPDIYDLAADIIGSNIGAFLYWREGAKCRN